MGEVMLYRPRPISREQFDSYTLQDDISRMRKYGPAGLTENAVYLNSFFLDRRFYIPFTAVQRIFKRIAMSKGGFTGKGMFASISYLVVQYDGGKEKQCIFKRESDVDLFLSAVNEIHPEIKTISKEGETRLERLRREEEKRYKKNLSETARESVDELRKEEKYLKEHMELCTRYSLAAKAKRANDLSRKSLKWLALAIVLGGVVSFIYGIHSLIAGTGDFGLYFLLFGLAAIFLFSGVSVIPTGKNNRKAIIRNLEEIEEKMDECVAGYPGFSIPARYAHPAALSRMIRLIREGKAETISEALDAMKNDLRSMNSSVQVFQEEYDEIVAVKPMFLIHDYA